MARAKGRSRAVPGVGSASVLARSYASLPSGASLLGEKVWGRVGQPEQELGR